MPGDLKRASHFIKLRSLLLATFLLLSVLALSSPTVSRVDAAPKNVPLAVTVTLYSTVTGPGNSGFCRQGTEDMGDPYGNVDFGNAGVELSELHTRSVATWGQVNYGETRFVEWNHRPCGGRSDSAVISLVSIPSTAIVQSATLSYHMLGASSNNPGSASGVIIAPFGSLSSVTTGSLDCNCWWSRALPLSTAQTWVTNRTSGGLSITYGDYWNGWWYTSDQQTLDITYILDTTPPTTTHALSGTLGNNGYYKSAVALALAAVDTESGVASTKLNGATYTTPLIITTEGTTTHNYYSTDVAGNVEVTKTVSVKIDTVSPATTATLTGLMGLNSWFVGPVTVSLAPTDSTSGVASSTLNGSAYTAPVSFSAQGTNSITYFSTDNAGNNETTQSASFKVDTVAPQASIALECPSSGDNGWCKSPLTVKLNGSDSTSGMESLTYNYNGETKTVTGASAIFNSGIGGTSSVTLYATDKSGQRSVTQSQEIKIDGAPPTIEFRGATQTVLFFRVSDGDSGVKSWTLQVFNAQGQSVFYKDGTGVFDGELAWSPSLGVSGGGKLFRLLPQGNQFTINLFAKDNAGHENGVQQASFTLNQIATAQPTATATSLPKIVIAVQPTKIPTQTQVAIAQLLNNLTIQQPNNPPPNNPPPPSNIQPPAFVPKEEKIIIPPAAVMENPVSPILGVTSLLMLMLGIIATAGFAANSFDERTQIVLAILVLLLTLGMGAVNVATQEPPPTTLDVPLRLQDPNTVFCGPASLGMAFDFINSKNTNSKLQSPNNQDIIRYMKENYLLYSFGTGVEELAYAARQQGYSGSFYFSDWTIGKLKEQIAAGRPILTPLQQNGYGQAVGHFLTVTGFSNDGNFVIVNDPLVGQRQIAVNEFESSWRNNGSRGVVVAPSPIPTIPDSAAPLFAGVGAAAALLALAALGTARKGLGAGLTEEEKDTWQNYSEPVKQPVETWANYASYTPDPPEETWFDLRVYDEGAHEQTLPSPPPPQDGNTYSYVNQHSGQYTPPSPSSNSSPSNNDGSFSSSNNQQTPDAGLNDAPDVNQSGVSNSLPTEKDWGDKSDAELIAQAEQEAAQRRREIKTVEDAKKVAQEEADRAIAQMIAEEEAKQKAMEAVQQRVMTSRNGQQGYVVDGKFVALAPEKPKEKSWWEKAKNFVSNPVGIIRDTLITAGQNDANVKKLLVGVNNFITDPGKAIQDTIIEAGQNNPAVRDVIVGVSKAWNWYDQTVNQSIRNTVDWVDDNVIQPIKNNVVDPIVQTLKSLFVSSDEDNTQISTLAQNLTSIAGSILGNLINGSSSFTGQSSHQQSAPSSPLTDVSSSGTPPTPTPTPSLPLKPSQPQPSSGSNPSAQNIYGDPLDSKWEENFLKMMGRNPTDKDRRLYLLSLLHPERFSWTKDNIEKATKDDKSFSDVFEQQFSLDQFDKDIQKLHILYGSNKDDLIRAYAMMFAGVPYKGEIAGHTYTVPSWIAAYQSSGGPVGGYLSYAPKGMDPKYQDGDRDNTHHYSAYVFYSYTFSSDIAKLVNQTHEFDGWTKEVQKNYEKSRGNEPSGNLIGQWVGALVGTKINQADIDLGSLGANHADAFKNGKGLDALAQEILEKSNAKK